MISRALIAAICVAAALASLGRAETIPEIEGQAEANIAQARDLFLANRLMEALQALDEQTLARSGKANLLAGLIHLYRPRADTEAAKLHLERAGKLGIAHAFAILGNLILDEGCADCPLRAEVYYRHSLEEGEDSEPRFGLALALYKLGRKEAAQREFEHLVSGRTPHLIRMWAASFLGAMLLRSNPEKAEDLLSVAALEDFAEAQAALGFFYLREGQEERGRFWLTRAVAHRSEIAMHWYWTLPVDQQSRVLLETGGYLLELEGSKKNTEFSRAAEWCKRSGRIDLLCLSRAADHHQECDLSPKAHDLLEISEFHITAVYGSCRSREKYGKPLPEKPLAWPRVAE